MQNKILIWNNFETIELLKSALKKNQLCAGSTDTVLGLLSNATNDGYEKLNEVKKRSSKPFIVLVSDLEKLSHFAQIDLNNKKLIKFIKHIWPSPVTIIFKSKKSSPFYLKSLDESIAVRIPKHAYLLQLLTFFDGLFSTSANLSGDPVPEAINQLNPNILNSVEYIVGDNYDLNYRYPIIPSTILDFTNEKVKVVREGIIPIDQLELLYGEKFEK